MCRKDNGYGYILNLHNSLREAVPALSGANKNQRQCERGERYASRSLRSHSKFGTMKNVEETEGDMRKPTGMAPSS